MAAVMNMSRDESSLAGAADIRSLDDQECRNSTADQSSAPPRSLEELMVQRGVSLVASDYHPMLGLMEVMMGHKPKLNELVKIWQPGFKGFHLLFKNLTGMPTSMLGPRPLIQDIFLALYASSREADCYYCAVAMANVAMRKGIKSEQILRTVQTPKDDAVFRLSRGLVQGDLEGKDVQELQKYYKEDKLETLALSVCLAGYLNLVSKSCSLSLDKKAPLAVCEMFSASGWSPKGNSEDNEDAGDTDTESEASAQITPQKISSIEQVKPETLGSFLDMAKHAPHAMYVEHCWLQGVPKSVARSQCYLKKHTGYSFPLLKQIKNAKAVQTISAVLKDHFDPTLTEVGLVTKALAGLTFASTKKDESLLKEAIKLTAICAKREKVTIDPTTLEEIGKTLSRSPVPSTVDECRAVLERLCELEGIYNPEMAAAVVLARALSTNPVQVSPVIVQEVASLLTEEAIMEIVSYIGLQQCLSRIQNFVRARNDACNDGSTSVCSTEEEDELLSMPPATKISVDDLNLMQQYRRQSNLGAISEDAPDFLTKREGSDPSIGHILNEVDSIITDDEVDCDDDL